MSLDQFASTVSTKTSHPRGEFVGVIEYVKKEQTKKGTTMINIKVKTPSGYPPDFKLGFVTEEDFSRAKFQADNGDAAALSKISTTIAMTKQTLVRLGLVNKDVVDAMGYTQCLRELPKLIGKRVKVQVIEQKNNPEYNETRLSKHDEVQVTNSSSPSNGFSVDEVPF